MPEAGVLPQDAPSVEIVRPAVIQVGVTEVIGSKGEPGQDGVDGQDGADGADGQDGADSTVPGPPGDKGDPGEKGDPGDPGSGDVSANANSLAQRTSTGALRAQTPQAVDAAAHPDDLINRGYATPYLQQVTANTENLVHLSDDLTDTNEVLEDTQEAVVVLAGNLDNIGGRVVVLENAPDIPSMSGQGGKFLGTNGSALAWGTPAGGGGGASLDVAMLGRWEYREYVQGDAVYLNDRLWVATEDVALGGPTPGDPGAHTTQIGVGEISGGVGLSTVAASGGLAKGAIKFEVTPDADFRWDLFTVYGVDGSSGTALITVTVYVEGGWFTDFLPFGYNQPQGVGGLDMFAGEAIEFVVSIDDGGSDDLGNLRMSDSLTPTGDAGSGSVPVSFVTDITDPSPVAQTGYVPTVSLQSSEAPVWREAYDPEDLLTRMDEAQNNITTLQGLPVLPYPDAEPDGKVLTVESGAWVVADPPAGGGGGGISATSIQGEWIGGTTYDPNDVVLRNEGTYIALVESTDVDPSAPNSHTQGTTPSGTGIVNGGGGSALKFTAGYDQVIDRVGVKPGNGYTLPAGTVMGLVAGSWTGALPIPWLAQTEVPGDTVGPTQAIGVLDVPVSLVTGSTYWWVVLSPNVAGGSGSGGTGVISATGLTRYASAPGDPFTNSFGGYTQSLELFGPQDPTWTTLAPGPHAAPLHRGVYDDATTYLTNQMVVADDGSGPATWMAMETTTGSAPPSYVGTTQQAAAETSGLLGLDPHVDTLSGDLLVLTVSTNDPDLTEVEGYTEALAWTGASLGGASNVHMQVFYRIASGTSDDTAVGGSRPRLAAQLTTLRGMKWVGTPTATATDTTPSATSPYATLEYWGSYTTLGDPDLGLPSGVTETSILNGQNSYSMQNRIAWTLGSTSGRASSGAAGAVSVSLDLADFVPGTSWVKIGML